MISDQTGYVKINRFSATTNDERRFVLSNVNGSESLFQNALKNNVKAIINFIVL